MYAFLEKHKVHSKLLYMLSSGTLLLYAYTPDRSVVLYIILNFHRITCCPFVVFKIINLVFPCSRILRSCNNNKTAGKMVEDYWGPSLKMLSDFKFLENLKTFDKDNIPPPLIKKIRDKYLKLIKLFLFAFILLK